MYAQVIVDILNSNVDKIYDYKLDEHSITSIGSRVLVPFAGRNVEGYIVSISPTTSYDQAKIKNIIKFLDKEPLLNEKIIKLAFYMKKRFNIRVADAIRLCLPPQVRSDMGAKEQIIVRLKENINLSSIRANATQQIALIKYLHEVGSADKVELVKKFGLPAFKKLDSYDFFETQSQQKFSEPINKFSVEKKVINLTDLQKNAVNEILCDRNSIFLLHGVTGSGKTEIYLNCIEQVLKEDKTAIMLVPEISLTPQMLGRFRNRFGDNVALLHSMLSPRQRFDEWYRLKTGKAKIALGARSCIFAPLDNIGLIIIDEEHDTSYFSESNPRYYTHEVAKYLAKLYDCPLILGSATPSIESYYNVKIGNYKLIELPNRANSSELPKIQIVDMLSEIRNGNSGIFSTAFLSALDECISNKKQAMIFINRRGYSSFVMCRECGYVPKCEDCDVSLVYHKDENMLKCHYCSKRYKALDKCPNCGSDSIRFGAVGTQRIVDELQKLYSNVKILRLDNDATSQKDSYINILQEFNTTTPAILVGTQMIAKGHDFNNVTLVGIIDADLSLHFSDFRATERTFQLITQVAGRAGRSKYEGKVILQTYYPKHYVYRCVANYDYKRFFDKEISLRETTHFPPFAKIVRVLITSLNDEKAYKITKDIYNKINLIKKDYTNDFIYLQAMKCPKKRIQKKYRYEVLMRIFNKNYVDIIDRIYKVTQNTIKDVSIFVEENPQVLS